MGMLILFFSKNRLSFWKNWFFFDYRIWVSLSCYAAGYYVTCCAPGVGVASSAVGLSNLYSLLSTHELMATAREVTCLARRNAPLPTEAVMDTQPNMIVYCCMSRWCCWCHTTFPQFAGHLWSEWAAVQCSQAAGLTCMFRPTRIDRLLTARGKIFIWHNITFE